MRTKILYYNVIINKEGKDFIAHVPTLGISDFGISIDEAKKNVQKAIEIHIEGLLKTKSEVPAADSADIFISQSEVSIPENIVLAI